MYPGTSTLHYEMEHDYKALLITLQVRGFADIFRNLKNHAFTEGRKPASEMVPAMVRL